MTIEQNTLYLVGTPLGNLSDISPRALEVLGGVDFIAAEDTRNTLHLLTHFGIKKELVSYYEHNKRERGEQIVSRILSGERCALVSDAGMPAISDPGEDLAALCHERGIQVSPIPGPTALISALAASGLPSGRFCFEGFLSTASKSRRAHLAELKGERRTMIFYEAPHKLCSTLADLLTALGDRELCLGRELTKKFEEVHRTTLAQAAAYYEQNTPKGEFVLVVAGEKEQKPEGFGDETLQAMLLEHLQAGKSKKEAVLAVCAETKEPKNRVYALCMEL